MVEDNPQVREILALMLQAYGYDVLEAAGPDDAIRLFAENSVDLLMTDIGMPKMNGVELANRLRAARPGLRVLFVSGYSAETHERELDTASGCVFLQKGTTSETLAATVRQLLDALPVH